MAITPGENLEELRRIQAGTRGGAAAAAEAMAKYIRDRVRNDTLQRSYHAPGAFNRQKPGRPPARASGALADHDVLHACVRRDTGYGDGGERL